MLFRNSVDTFSRLTPETTGGPVGLPSHEFLLAGNQLAREGVTLATTTIWRLLRRHRSAPARARLAVLERASATRGLLTERP